MDKLPVRKLNIGKAFAAALCLLMLFSKATPVLASYEVTVSIPVTIEITDSGSNTSDDSTTDADDSTTDSIASADTVTVTMTPQDDAPAPTETAITITGAGTGTFEGLTYTKPGDYVYTVQMSGTSEDVEYDATVYTVTVRVTNSDGSLTADYWAVQDDSTGKTDEIVFSNVVSDTSAYYIVEHYLEQLDGTYELEDSYTYTAEIGDVVMAVPNSYEHYSENTSHEDRVESGTVYEPVIVTAASAASADAMVTIAASEASAEAVTTIAISTSSAETVITDASASITIATATAASSSEDVLTLRLYYDLDRYTVTYTDGVDGSIIFEDQVYSSLPYGTETPAFDGTPTRDGYIFMGWSPTVEDTVTGDMIYEAIWEPVAETSTSASTTEEDTTQPVSSDEDNSSTGWHIKTGDVKWFVMWGCIALFLCGGGLIFLACHNKGKQD